MAIEQDYDGDIHGSCNITVIAEPAILNDFKKYVENYQREEDDNTLPFGADGYRVKSEKGYYKMAFTFGNHRLEENDLFSQVCGVISDFGGTDDVKKTDYKAFVDIRYSFTDYEGCNYGIYKSGNWEDLTNEEHHFMFDYSEYPIYDEEGNNREPLNSFFTVYIDDKCKQFLVESGAVEGSVEEARENCGKSLKYAKKKAALYLAKDEDYENNSDDNDKDTGTPPAAPIVAAKPAPTVQTPSAKGPACPRCGKVEQAGARFCSACGTRLAQIDPVCANCGQQLKSAPNFCPQCGMKVVKG